MSSRAFLRRWILVTIFLNVIASGGSDGVFDKIKAGFQYANDYMETAKDIADLVAKSLGRRTSDAKEDERDNVDHKTQSDFGPSNLVSSFFRLLGLDSQKIAAIALNSVIFLAQMISSLFDLRSSKDKISKSITESTESTWDPLKYILENENEKLRTVIRQARDDQLLDQLTDTMKGFEFACVRSLTCKMSPIVRAAQKSLGKSTENTKARPLTTWLPSREEFERNSDECEEKHTDCPLFQKTA